MSRSHHDSPFQPGAHLRHPHLQSFLASFRGRNWPRRGHPMARAAAFHELDCGGGVRLCGWHSPQPVNPTSAADRTAPRGLVVLIHGWEGSHESAYLFSMACTLYAAGYSVFRLNLRDHGGSHHLNEDLFHSARMDEVFGALRAIRALDPAGPLHVAGFSLGGNFALRVGLKAPQHGIEPALSIGICPAINPGATLRALDEGPKAFQRYFLKKWHRNLAAKRAAWPQRYDFGELMPLTNFTEITRAFVERFTEYGALDRYLAAYTLVEELAQEPATPLAILTAQDDPVVPYADFAGLHRGERLRLLAPAHGGHCGFIENLRMQSWAEKQVLGLLQRE